MQINFIHFRHSCKQMTWAGRDDSELVLAIFWNLTDCHVRVCSGLVSQPFHVFFLMIWKHDIFTYSCEWLDKFVQSHNFFPSLEQVLELCVRNAQCICMSERGIRFLFLFSSHSSYSKLYHHKTNSLGVILAPITEYLLFATHHARNSIIISSHPL